MSLLRIYAIGFYTIVRKEVVRFFRIWTQSILPAVITMTLYFVIFGSLIGSRVGKVGGFEFMQYIAPGLIMMSVITNSYANVSSSFFGTKFSRSVEELLVAPLPHSLILLGYMVGGVLRGLVVGLIVTLIALFFTHLHLQHAGYMITVVLATAILFSLAGFLNGLLANNFDDIMFIPTFVLTPLTYLGGVFYSIDVLSPFWQQLSRLNPVLYMVNAFRYGVLGVSDVFVPAAFAILFSLIAVFFGLALYLLRRGVGIRS